MRSHASSALPATAGAPTAPSRLTLSANGVRRTLISVIVALVLVHVAFQIVNYLITPTPWLYRELFHLDEEDSFPTWYSAVALLAASVLLFVVAARKRGEGDRWRWHWLGLALGFVLLSMDEVVGLHETLNSETDFSWTLVGGPLVVGVFAIYARFLQQLPDPFRSRLLIAGMIFVTGAVVIEYVQNPIADAGLINSLGYNLAVVPEEAAEMLGIVVLIHALIDYLGRDGRITLSLGAGGTDVVPEASEAESAAIRSPFERSA
jgi:hypothetical protein